MAIRILLADDHQIVRDGLSALLAQKGGDYHVVAQAADGRAAVNLARELKPDVVIMDVAMPELNGPEATRQIVSEQPNTKIVGLSMHYDKRFLDRMFAAGASAYLLKECAFQELHTAIVTVMAGNKYVGSTLSGMVVDAYVQSVSEPRATLDGLTAREREVLQLIAEGKPTRDIAQNLNVSVKTIESHRRRLMEKLGLPSVAELTKYAVREGLTSLDR